MQCKSLFLLFSSAKVLFCDLIMYVLKLEIHKN